MCTVVITLYFRLQRNMTVPHPHFLITDVTHVSPPPPSPQKNIPQSQLQT